MQYSKSKMELLVKNNAELTQRLKQIMKEHELEKSFALKALYHCRSERKRQVHERLSGALI